MTTPGRFLKFNDDVYNKNKKNNDEDDYIEWKDLFSDDYEFEDEDSDSDSGNQKEINPKKLIELYKQEDKDSWFGRELVMDGIYVECGRQMVQMFKKDEDHKAFKQVTIRSIRLYKPFQKKRLFTSFVEYLLSLDTIDAVQLESVQSEWLKERLTKSTHWYKQGISENYVRFKERENNKKFSLF